MKPSQLSNNLRRIAARIDNSKNPSRILVARELRRVLAAMDLGNPGEYMAKLTTYDEMNNASGMTSMEGNALYDHLDASQDNAVVVGSHTGGPIAVWNSPDMSGVYWGFLPLEDPNNAEFVPGRDPGEWMNSIFG